MTTAYGLPKVHVRRYDDGWTTTCSSCSWRLWRHGRIAVDIAAIAHYASHAQGGRG